MSEVVIVDGVRTAIGNFGGALKTVTAHMLGEVVVRELVKKTGIDTSRIDEVIFGCVGQYSDAANIARVISLFAGLPIETTAYTVQRNCSSGLQAIVNACHNIASGDADIQIAGGSESMSQSPYVNRSMRFGQRIRHSTMIDALWEALTDAYCGELMGQTAERLADDHKIPREEQDKFAVESHRKAFRAIREEKFKDEIVPVSIPKKVAGKKVAPEIFSQDEGVNIALTEQELALHPTIFAENGTVTPGNSCPLSDGASALLVMSAEKAQELNYTPLGYIKSYAFAGVEPGRMGIGPANAIPKALKKAGMQLPDIELFEINEALRASSTVERCACPRCSSPVTLGGG